MEKAIDAVSRLAFGTASLVLMLMSLGLVAFGIVELFGALSHSMVGFGEALLAAIGYIIIAVAVFDVAKYFVNEEVLPGRSIKSYAGERRRLAKFMSIISIARGL